MLKHRRYQRGFIAIVFLVCVSACSGTPSKKTASTPDHASPPISSTRPSKTDTVASTETTNAHFDAFRPSVGKLPLVAKPLRYDLHLTIDPSQPKFTGIVEITVEILQPTNRIFFHSQNGELHTITALVGNRTIPGQAFPTTGPMAEPTWGEKFAQFPQPFRRGETVTLRITFTSPFDGNLSGIYRAKHGTDWYAYSQFEAADARKAFPCFDEPGWKVPFQISLTVPVSLKAYSNALEQREQPSSDGKTKTIQFAQTKPLPTYLVAIVVGPLDVATATPSANMPLRGITARGKSSLAKESLAITRTLLPLLEQYFGIPYPYDKLDLAALVEFGSNAMENAGLITFREERLLLDETRSSPEERRAAWGVIAHELAHQWFGNLVTMAWWDDLWLNEAFATWMASKIVEKHKPDYRAKQDLIRARNRVFETDMLSAARAVRQPVRTVADAENAFDGLTYVKGASILMMIETWIGETAFRDGVRAYLKTHAWGNATASDLISELSREAKRDLAPMFRSFLDRPGVPLIQTTLTCDRAKDSTEITLSQSPYAALGTLAVSTQARAESADKSMWHIPVCVLFPTGNRLERRCVILDRPTMTVPIDGECPRWIYPNADESGYYRWSLTPELLHKLLNAPELSSDSKVSILEEAWSMVAAGLLEPSFYVQALSALRNSDSVDIADHLVNGLERLRGRWEGETPSPEFRRFAKYVLLPWAKKLGWNVKAQESYSETQLRTRILNALDEYGGSIPSIRTPALAIGRRYLTKPSTVDPKIAPVALKILARAGKVGAAELFTFASTSTTPSDRLNALDAMIEIPPGKPFNDVLVGIIDGNIRAQDLRYVLYPSIARHEIRRQSFEFIVAHFDEMRKRLPTFGRGSISRLAQVVGLFCDEAEATRARTFFETNAVEGSQRFLQLGIEAAAQCIAQRNRGMKSFKKAISN